MNTLPIDQYQEAIESTVHDHPVVIITAETGAGKSTRVPLWLWRQKHRIAVTQPRRIAARSLSYYLAKQIQSPWGKQVGYQTGFDQKRSTETTLLYLTDGVQMIKEIQGRHDYDVLILDEIHEWNLNQDILIGLVKKKLQSGFFERSRKRVIIMSATLHTRRLSAFFNDAPVIEVPGRGYPVTVHHNQPEFLLSDTIQMVEMGKNLLVFQPGKGEIADFIQQLRETLDADKLKAKIFPLHSELSIKEQAKVFEHFTIPKVIVATDIAQTSLTIDDIDAVIDTGIKKEIRVYKGIEGLYPIPISNAECLQRAGRAGRVKPGQYVLCSEVGPNDRLPYPEPEIRRLNLESVILRMIKWGIQPTDFPYFHPPKNHLIHKAKQNLRVFGAISDEDTITKDGQKMADLPVSIRCARMLLEAQQLSPHITESVLKLIAILETKGITNKEYMGEKYYASPLQSDLLNQLMVWENSRSHRRVVNQKKFTMAKEIYRELKKRLAIKEKPHSLSSKDIPAVFRSILSAFLDHPYIKTGTVYIDQDEERELDKASVLSQSPPTAVVGMPFDLVIERENRYTAEKEKFQLSLITFASEISPKILNQLRPFSYRKEEHVSIQNNKLTVFHKVHFGGRLLFEYTSSPDWADAGQRKLLRQAISGWMKENHKNLKFMPRLQENRDYFREAVTILSEENSIQSTDLAPFRTYWDHFMIEELSRHPHTDDLKLFFDVHPPFFKLTLKDLLPRAMIELLKRRQWPKKIKISEKNYPLIYIKAKPFIKMDQIWFEQVKRDDITLPTGERPGIILGKRTFSDWDTAVYYFNRWKKGDIFEKKWKNSRKKPRMDDVVDLPFPQPFNSGQDKNKQPFEFYSVPDIERGEVYLIHFLTQEAALAHYETIKTEWNHQVQRYKKSKLDSMFKSKGWKVK